MINLRQNTVKKHLMFLGIRFMLYPFLIVLILSSVISYNVIWNTTHTSNERILDIIELQVSHYLSHPSDELTMFITLWKTNSFDFKSEDAFFNYIRRIEVINSEGYVSFTTPHIPDRIGFDTYNSVISEAKDSDDIQILKSVVDPITRKPSLYMTKKLKSGEQVLAVLDLSRIQEFVSEMLHEVDATVAIIDSSGTFIAHTSQESVDQRSVFSDFNDLKSGKIKNRDAILINNIESRIYFNRLDISDWYLVLFQNNSIITNQVLKQMLPYLSIAIILPILLISAIKSANRINQPLSKLLNMSKSVSEGLYSYDMTEKHNRFEEFETLIKGFDKMAYNVQSREEEIQTLNSELQKLLRTKEVDLRSAVEELGTAQEQLFKSEKAKALQGLVSGITHEINTPLGISITLSSHLEELIKGYFNAGNIDLDDKDDITEIFEMLNKNLNYLVQLIVSFKRISVNQERENIEIFKLDGYIKDIFLVHKSSLKKHQISLDYQLDDITINSYPDLFGKIISILITNCIDHAFSNESKNKTLSIKVYTINDMLYINYGDNGLGIPEDLIPIVFDPFITTKRSTGNTGLGMNILNNIVIDCFKGTINIFNNSPGLTIELAIPVKSFENSKSVIETINIKNDL